MTILRGAYMELKFYIDFMSHEEAQKGFDILLDYATRNNNFLSYVGYISNGSIITNYLTKAFGPLRKLGGPFAFIF